MAGTEPQPPRVRVYDGPTALDLLHALNAQRGAIAEVAAQPDEVAHRLHRITTATGCVRTRNG